MRNSADAGSAGRCKDSIRASAPAASGRGVCDRECEEGCATRAGSPARDPSASGVQRACGRERAFVKIIKRSPALTRVPGRRFQSRRDATVVRNTRAIDDSVSPFFTS